MELSSLVGLAGFILVTFLAASGGVAFPPGAWYEGLKKPGWRPPNWLFAPAWTILYILMGVAAWLVWRAVGFAGGGVPLGLYLLQLLLNAAWTPIFFGLRKPNLAFFEIVLLWLAIAATIAAFHAVDTVAAWLLVPYLAWVTFAACLNLAIWRLNPKDSIGPAKQPGRPSPQ